MCLWMGADMRRTQQAKINIKFWLPYKYTDYSTAAPVILSVICDLLCSSLYLKSDTTLPTQK